MNINMENIGSVIEMNKDIKMHVGPVEVYDHFAGVFMSKLAECFGPIDIIKVDEIKVRGNLMISNDYLKSLANYSTINCNGVFELEENVDSELFNNKIKFIKIHRNLSIYEDQKELIIKKLYEEFDDSKSETKIGVSKALFTYNNEINGKLRILKRNYAYIAPDTKLDAFNFMSTKEAVISSRGIIILDKDITNELLEEKGIMFESEKRVYFPQELSKNMSQYLINNTKGVPYNPSSFSLIGGEQKLTPARIKLAKADSCFVVIGELKIVNDVSLEEINEKIGIIDNYGSIEASIDTCSILQDKIRYNEGSLDEFSTSDTDNSEDLSKYDNVIQNTTSYQL